MEHRISLEDECRWVRVLIQLVRMQTATMHPVPPWARPDLPRDTYHDSQKDSAEEDCCAEG